MTVVQIKPFKRRCRLCDLHIQDREVLYTHMKDQHSLRDIDASISSDGGQSRWEHGVRTLKSMLKEYAVDTELKG